MTETRLATGEAIRQSPGGRLQRAKAWGRIRNGSSELTSSHLHPQRLDVELRPGTGLGPTEHILSNL